MDILKVLANPTNQAILGLLKAEPTYARRTAILLGLSESEVTRRLRQMEKAGLVAGAWSNIGRNVKMYGLATNEIKIQVQSSGLRVIIGTREETYRDRSIFLRSPEPPQTGPVVGRDIELQEMTKCNVIVVHGLAGIGKTTLVAEAARLREAPVFWHSVRGVESVGWLLNQLAVACSRNGNPAWLDAAESCQTQSQRMVLLQEIFESAELVVVLDDLHLLESHGLLAALRDAAANPRTETLILTSREPIPVPPTAKHICAIHLTGLDAEGTKKLLQDVGVTTNQESILQLALAVGGHPLALRLAADAAKRQGCSLESVVARLPQSGLDDYLLAEVDSHLSDDERVVLGAASTFRGSFSESLLRSIQPKAKRGALLRLVRHGMAMCDQPGEYRLHEMVRDHFYRRLDDRRMFHKRASQAFEGMRTIEGHLEALHQALEAQDQDTVERLILRNLDIDDYGMVDGGYAMLYERILNKVLAKDIPARLHAIIADERGDLCLAAHKYDEALAHYQEAKAYFDAHPDGWEDEDIAWKRARCLQALNRQKEAAEVLEQAIPGAPAGRVRKRLTKLREELA